MDSKAPRRDEIVGIQHLRGLAAALVVIYHLSLQYVQLFPGSVEFSTLRSGVDIFFVISGMVMVYSTAAGTNATGWAFLRRRLARIAPMYWLFTLLAVAMLLAVPQLVKSSRLDPLHALSSMLFLSIIPNPVGGSPMPLVTPGWTLNLEMMFYLVFAAAIWLGRRRRPHVVLLAAAMLCLLAFTGICMPARGARGFYTDPILLEFVYGMALGVAVLRFGVARSRLCALAAIGAFAVLLLPPEGDLPRYVRFGLPALAIAAGMTFGAMPRSRILHGLGDISYSLYLSHFFTLSAFAQAWRRLGVANAPWAAALFYGAGLLVSLVVGVIVWRLVEVPLNRRVQSLLSACTA